MRDKRREENRNSLREEKNWYSRFTTFICGTWGDSALSVLLTHLWTLPAPRSHCASQKTILVLKSWYYKQTGPISSGRKENSPSQIWRMEIKDKFFQKTQLPFRKGNKPKFLSCIFCLHSSDWYVLWAGSKPSETTNIWTWVKVMQDEWLQRLDFPRDIGHEAVN